LRLEALDVLACDEFLHEEGIPFGESAPQLYHGLVLNRDPQGHCVEIDRRDGGTGRE
jgi:hypothetical protein